jgi:site-specific DNA-methyltransferase (adenine-specific)
MAQANAPTPYYDDGSVRIYHGDCREVAPLLDFDVVVSDPPYGVAHDTNYKRFGKSTNRDWAAPIHGDDEPFDPSPWIAHPCVLFGANYYADRLPIGRWIVWDKRDGVTPMLMADAELAWHNLPGRAVQLIQWTWNGFQRQGERGTAYHPTQKPVAVMRWIIETFAPAGVILDPYMGAGSTLRAAKDLGRRAVGIEIEERYCDAAARRCAQDVLDVA